MLTILIIVLLLLFIGGYPGFGFHSWGYLPMGSIGIVLFVVLLVLLLGGRV